MQPEFQTMTPAPVQAAAITQNRVLRNTYMLLALSLVPTLIGAWLGVTFQLGFMRTNPIISVVVFFAVAFGFFFAIEKFKNSALGVGLLLGFTFFMGLWVSQLLLVALSFSNGATVIGMAAGMTSVIFFALAAMAMTIKKDLSFMGKFLFIGAVAVIVAMLANMFFQIPALHLALSALCVVIFSAFILYDLNRIVMGGETNYVSATLALYLDIYNVFVSLLNILLAFTGQKE
jgi:modulator of FtsH protease